MRVKREIAADLVRNLLEEKGTPRSYALQQTDVLVEAELRGHPSHGLQRLPRILQRIGNGLIDPSTQGKSHWRTPSFLKIDGLRGLGPVVALQACTMLSERASSTGVAVAGIRNSNHLGMLAYYVEHLAKDGIIGIALSSSEALVHPPIWRNNAPPRYQSPCDCRADCGPTAGRRSRDLCGFNGEDPSPCGKRMRDPGGLGTRQRRRNDDRRRRCNERVDRSVRRRQGIRSWYGT